MTTTAGAATGPAILSPDSARVLTERIKSAADQLCLLLLEAHDRKAWEVLGYSSWREYAKTEFRMGQSHAYRLLDQARVVRALETVVDSPVGEFITERVARDVKPHLVEVTADAQERIAAGVDPEVAVRDAIDQLRTRERCYLDSRRAADRSNRIVATVVQQATLYSTDNQNQIDPKQLDEALVPEWVQELRLSARRLNDFAAWLERATDKPRKTGTRG